MNGWFAMALSVVVAGLVPSPAGAAPVTAEEATRCLDDMRRIHKDQALRVPIRVRCTVRMLYVPPRAELDRLIEEVRVRPEHPSRAMVPLYLARSRGEYSGSDRSTYDLWIVDRKLYRFGYDHDDAGHYTDLAVSGGSAWSLSNELILPKLETSSFEVSFGAGQVNNFFLMILVPIAAGLTDDSGGVGRLQMLPDRTVAIAQREPGGHRVLFTMTKGPGGRAVVSEVETDAPTQMPNAPRKVRLSGHREVAGETFLIPTKAVWLTAKGEPERDYSVELLDVVTREQVLEVTRVPSARSPDPIRGWNGQRVGSPQPPIEVMMATETPAPSPSGGAFRAWHAVLGAVVVAAAALGVWTLLRRIRGAAA